jgi:hypothetical protein
MCARKGYRERAAINLDLTKLNVYLRDGSRKNVRGGVRDSVV